MLVMEVRAPILVDEASAVPDYIRTVFRRQVSKESYPDEAECWTMVEVFFPRGRMYGVLIQYFSRCRVIRVFLFHRT